MSKFGKYALTVCAEKETTALQYCSQSATGGVFQPIRGQEEGGGGKIRGGVVREMCMHEFEGAELLKEQRREAWTCLAVEIKYRQFSRTDTSRL